MGAFFFLYFISCSFSRQGGYGAESGETEESGDHSEYYPASTDAEGSRVCTAVEGGKNSK